jgi:eukaryotic-like serine/threonine-protein kinase
MKTTPPDRWRRIEELFHRALEIAPEERGAYLERETLGDRALADAVVALLDADAVAESAIEGVVAEAFVGAVPPPDEGEAQALTQVGPYRILGEVGRGGLSTVYLAERDDEHFRKRVALKVVRRGLDTDDVLLRFRHERQILARFEHPNIAHLLDGGSTDDGRPFFVLELIEGEPIDAYCSRHALGVRPRIELFLEVCAAVSYAHQNLTIHRDLKPNNILVTADGRPKLLDFGIAKVLDADSGASTGTSTGPGTGPKTRTGLLLLTPEYASPEQIQGEVLTTQTDIYSLGLVLYRVLTGTGPYPPTRGHLGALRATIRQAEPGRPSATLTEDSHRRAGLPGDLARARRTLKGDLDTILLKTLRKNPQHRYRSVAMLEEDLRRFLAGEPVLARPESLRYRAAKFLARNRRLVSVLGVAALLLMATVLFYTVRLRAERDLAQREARRAEQVSSLLVGMLEVSDPSRARGETITVRELLGRAAARLEDDLTGQPELRASLMLLIGSIYRNLGLYDESQPLLEEALALRREIFSPPDPKIAEVLDNLGELDYLRGEYPRAEERLRAALRQRTKALGEEHALVGKSLNDLAAVLQTLGRWEEAETLYRGGLGTQRRSAGPADPQTLVTQANLAALLFTTGQLDEAEALCRETLEQQTLALGENHPDVAAVENTLAAVLTAGHKLREAEGLLVRGVERQRQLYGPGHPTVAVGLINLGVNLYHQERFAAAEARFREALALQKESLGPEHLQTATTLKNLADAVWRGRQDGEGAVGLLAEALRLQRQKLGPDHLSVAWTLLRLGRIEQERGESAAAGAALEEAERIHRLALQAGLDPVPARQREAAAALREALKTPE